MAGYTLARIRLTAPALFERYRAALVLSSTAWVDGCGSRAVRGPRRRSQHEALRLQATEGDRWLLDRDQGR